MYELNRELREALAAAPEEPLRVTDPETRREYVVLRAETYERLRSLLADDISMQQVSLLVERAMRDEDAEDPTLASYQRMR